MSEQLEKKDSNTVDRDKMNELSGGDNSLQSENGTNQNESSMDGLGKTIKKLIGVSKKDDTYLHTATLLPAGDVESCKGDFSTITSISQQKTGKGTSKEQKNYSDNATAMLGDKFTHEKGDNIVLKSEFERGDNPSLGSELKLNLPYVVAPKDDMDKPGLALIITGQKFEKGFGDDRIGAGKDLSHMFEVFHNLNFEIRWQQFVNRTTQDLKDELIKCAEDPTLEHKQCLVIIVSSHGGEVKLGPPYRSDEIDEDINVYGHAITTYNGIIPTTEILDIFDEDNCPLMEKNPKLLFIQACRSRNNVKKVEKGFEIKVSEDITSQVVNFFGHSSIDIKHGMDTEIEKEEFKRYEMLMTPCYENFLVVFASVSEYVGWSESDGGWLLSAMYDVFMKKIKGKEDINLLPTMTEVCKKMTEYESYVSNPEYDKSKSPMCLLHMLTEEIIFKPIYK